MTEIKREKNSIKFRIDLKRNFLEDISKVIERYVIVEGFKTKEISEEGRKQFKEALLLTAKFFIDKELSQKKAKKLEINQNKPKINT